MKAKRKLRIINLEQAEHDVALLEDEGHNIERFSDVHWRIDSKYDLWPSTKKYMKRDGLFRVREYTNIKDIFNGL